MPTPPSPDNPADPEEVATSCGPDELPDDEELTSADLRLAEALLEGRDETDVLAEMLIDGDEAGESALRFMALNRLAEEGLDLLSREGVASAVEDVAVGRRIGDYRLLQEIGSGGMGVLYLAEQTTLGRLVALKVLSKQSESSALRFQREAEITAGLDHPHIVPVHNVGEVDGVRFIAMRYIAGKDIEHTLSQSRESTGSSAAPLFTTAASWCARVADALHHAHEAGVIHRDVKPSNILVEGDHPYVVDFGLATQDDDLDLTKEGDLLGTVPYMSPEQIRAETDTLDRRTDVYSLGATLYQILAGSVPFGGRSSQVIARQILTRDPAPLSRYGIPRDLESIVFKAMEKDADRRYATAREMREDLERYLERLPVRARHLGPMRRGMRTLARHRTAVVLGLLGLAAILSIAVTLWQARENDRRRIEQGLDAARQKAQVLRWDAASDVLDELLEEFPDNAELRTARDRYRKHDLYDELMLRIHSLPALDDASLTPLFAEAESLGLPGVLGEEYVALRVNVERRHGSEQALSAIDRWERRIGGPARRTVALRVFASVAPEQIAERLRADLDEVEPRGRQDHLITAMTLALVVGVEEMALEEIELYLRDDPSHFWMRLIKGHVLRHLGRYGEAREVFSGLIAMLRPRDETENAGGIKLRIAYYERGLNQLLLGRYPEALHDLERGRLDDALWAWNLRVGTCHLRRGDFEAAHDHFARAVAELDEAEVPTRAGKQGIRGYLPPAGYRADALRSLGESCIQLGRWEDAEAAFDRIGAEAGRARYSEEMLARLAYIRSGVAGSGVSKLDVLSQVDDSLEAYPESALLVSLRAQILWDLMRREGALASLDAAVKRNPDDVHARFTRGYLLARRLYELVRADFITGRDTGDDRAAYLKTALDDMGTLERRGFHVVASEVGVDEETCRFFLAALCHWSGQNDTALEMLDRLVREGALRGQAWSDKLHMVHGHVLAAKGRDDEALAAWRRAVDLVPGHPHALAHIARAAARLGRVDDVAAALRGLAPHLAPGKTYGAELTRSDYDGVRSDPKLARWFD